MTATSLGTAAGGDGPHFPALLAAPFKERQIKTIENGRSTEICAAGAVDARNQEKAGNPGGLRQEPEVFVVAALAPPLPLKVQEPVNKKRGHDFDGEMIWASKKQRSSMAAAPESGSAIAEAAAAATPSPIVQELRGNRDGGNPICKKKGHHLRVAMDEKAVEKLRPCVFSRPAHGLDGLRQDWEVTVLDIALPSQRVQKPVKRDHPQNGEDECLLIKRSCLATVAVCEGSNGAVHQNRAIPSAPSRGTRKPTRRISPTQEAKAGGRWGGKNNNHSGRDQPHNGEEACLLIKRSCLATVAVCEGSNGAVHQNRAIPSAPSRGTRKPTRRSSPMQEAKAGGQRGGKNNNHSGRKTPMRPFMSLSSGLQCLGVTDVTPVLAKTLTASDSSSGQSRLQVSPREVMDSPLMNILTPEECESVHHLNKKDGLELENKDGLELEDKKDGLELEAIDRHGYSYNMRLKYSYTASAYRLMQGWVSFLTQNSIREGDMVEVGAFRVHGRPMLTLLNYATKGWIPEEKEAADGLLMLSDSNDGTRS